MDATTTPYPHAVAATLRRWRALRRIKQSHAAELFGVSQSTVSRWEAGTLTIGAEDLARIEPWLVARLDSPADGALARLVNFNALPVHLVCDLTHRLLACSPSRAAEFCAPVSTLMGKSLWPFATEAIQASEASLRSAGWGDRPAQSVEFDTGCNASTLVPIRDSRCRWTRFTLSDGTVARLVETLERPRTRTRRQRD
ncbi:transcriptional regulator [Pandoraea captiosa]|uniref:Transcriptional regulator n=1 Tax=Pandoraea captiosa TaxID=2508302 RepID=A0A5E5A235_9BURK|nr:helix-turn-helix transcriptional regulator [Pandoraea captiosa]VVE66605.1 transcriptional regulator [Pandoraea captiosa]